jgi:hypothetical protein
MTEAEFVSRFQRGQSFSPGVLFLGIDLAKELDRMAAIQRAASKLAGETFATAA